MKYRVRGIVKLDVTTIVEAASPQEAVEAAWVEFGGVLNVGASRKMVAIADMETDTIDASGHEVEFDAAEPLDDAVELIAPDRA